MDAYCEKMKTVKEEMMPMEDPKSPGSLAPTHDPKDPQEFTALRFVLRCLPFSRHWWDMHNLRPRSTSIEDDQVSRIEI
eukprot:4662545-Amphidinium_carterae.1